MATTAIAGPDVEALMFAGRLDEAMTAAQTQSQANPGDLDAQERYIDVLATLGLANRAEATYRARVAKHPEDADAHYLLGRALFEARTALAAYEHALRLDPDHARAHMGVAAVRMAQGRPDLAEAAYRRALERDDSLSEAWNGLVNAFLAQGAREPALAVARQSMVVVPHAAEGYLAAAKLAPDEARSLLQQGVKNAGHDARLHSDLSVVLLSAGQAEQALESAELALETNPSDRAARLTQLFARAIVSGRLDQAGYEGLLQAQRLEQKDFAAAIDDYEALVQAHPKSALAWMGRSRIRRAGHDLEGALADLAEAVRVEPQNIEAAAVYGTVLRDREKHAEAAEWLGRAAKARPWDPSLAVAWGQSLVQAGQVERGKRQLEKAWARFPYDARVGIAYADSLTGTGDYDAAYKVVREAAERIPDPALAVALALAARNAGRKLEAAQLLDVIAQRTGSVKIQQAADELRAED